jgi:hypothetical protein
MTDLDPENGSAVSYPADILEEFLDNLQEWLPHGTWIVWYIRDSDVNLEPLWQGYIENHTERSKDQVTKGKKWNGYDKKWDSAIQEGRNDVSADGRKWHHFIDISPDLQRTDFKCGFHDNASIPISRKRKTPMSLPSISGLGNVASTSCLISILQD